MKSKFRFFITLAISLAIVWLLNNQMGQVPPLGKFLDPVNGVWHNALIPDIPTGQELKIPGLQEEVSIIFNERGVPHIFARNHHDLYFATGYVMAMHRLWQMEFTTHASLGRISEVVGERAIEFDKYLRRIGMTHGAEKMLEATKDDQITMDALDAFSNGVNAWIETLPSRKLPFEYKLFDYKPEPWSPYKTLALGMSISRTLTFHSQATGMSALKAKWGEDTIIALYTAEAKFNEPVVSAPARGFSILPPAKPRTGFVPQFILDQILPEKNPDLGSNNWAVSGRLTESGFPMLATDPHLGLSLPSIWYEVHLNAPGINVYGVTFAGVPAVIMGFNDNIAWGNTNTGNEVLDIFEIELNENETHYCHDGQWLPLQWRVEEYRIRGGKSVTDSIPYTHHGPLVYRASEAPFGNTIPRAHAIRWTATESGNVLKSMMGLNTASNITEFRNSLSKLDSPTQNYGFASRSGDIAKQLNGLWPLKWRHQGMFISDGRNKEFDWKGFIPFEDLPYEINPSRGFVSSANQSSAPSDYPFYNGWSFANNSRANIINSYLSQNRIFTVDDMKELQLNKDNFWAQTYLDRMLDSLDVWYENNPVEDEFSNKSQAIQYLLQWDKVNDATSVAATIFERWRIDLMASLWKPLLDPVRQFRPMMPVTDISFMVLFHEEPVSVYEKLFGSLPATTELLAKSFENTISRLESNHGTDMDVWEWWKFNGTTINHILDIEALNIPRLKVGGSSGSPNAISGNNGPSWRMVVSLGDTLQAWGVYPGGQASNPATKGYDAFVNDWAAGNYYPLYLFSNVEDAKQKYQVVLTLKP